MASHPPPAHHPHDPRPSEPDGANQPHDARSRRCLVVQHAEPEGPYRIGSALAQEGITLVTCRTFAGERLPPDLHGYNALVVMGGPMSAAPDEHFPTRADELRLIKEALARQLPTLGVCLGAQLLALAAGAPVYPGGAGQEIGWGPVRLTGQAAADELLCGLTGPLQVLHWHGDTFDLPVGAVHLASSPRYRNQAFRLGHRAWGLQFHLEVDETAVRAFLAAFGPEAMAAGVSPQSIADLMPEMLAGLGPARDLVLQRFATVVRGAA